MKVGDMVRLTNPYYIRIRGYTGIGVVVDMSPLGHLAKVYISDDIVAIDVRDMELIK